MVEPKKCMKCDKPVAYRIIKIVKGKIHDFLVCGEHAQELSPTLKHNKETHQVSQANLFSLIKHFLSQQEQNLAGGTGEEDGGAVCPNCHLNYGKYRETPLLGCSDCYSAFEHLLVKDLRKFHGAVSQTAEDVQPAEPEKTEDQKTRIPPHEQAGVLSLSALKKQMSEAVQGEDFEKAAQLRDAIRAIEGKQSKKNKGHEQ